MGGKSKYPAYLQVALAFLAYGIQAESASHRTQFSHESGRENRPCADNNFSQLVSDTVFDDRGKYRHSHRIPSG